MQSSPNPHEINREFIIQRYKGGIKLVRPTNDDEHMSRIDNIYKMPEPWFFIDTSSKFVDGNENLSVLVNANSVSDMAGKDASNFCSRDFSLALITNDQSIMRAKSTTILEESGLRKDNIFLHALAIKFPWYHDDKIIGLLGCSLMVESNSLSKTASSLTSIMMSGLLDSQRTLSLNDLSQANNSNIYFSKRELDVISHLLKGKSTKEIANQLFISRRTLEHHIDNIKAKANCKTRYELIYKLSNTSN